MTFITPESIPQEASKKPIIYVPSDQEFGQPPGKDPPAGTKGVPIEKWESHLRVGKEVYLSTRQKIKSLKTHESFQIQPGEFALILTKERVKLPPGMAAMINLRLTYKARGLVNISGFHVDPNYHGHLMFSVFNAGTKAILLREDDPVFMMIFVKLTNDVDAEADGNFNKGIARINANVASYLQSPVASVADMYRDLRQMKAHVTILYTILVAIVTGAAGAIVASLV